MTLKSMLDTLQKKQKKLRSTIGAASLCFIVSAASSVYAQSNDYFPSVNSVKGTLISPADALSYYTSGDGWTFPVTQDEYRPRDDSRFKELAATLGYDQAAWAGLSGGDLNNAKDEFVTAAFEYVRNNTDFTPMFGLQHGAMGAMYHKSGTAFDQSHMLVELMHVAGIDARYHIGTFSPSAADFKGWFGTDVPKYACEILANGGIPATVNNSSDCSLISGYASDPAISVTLAHVWVSINIGGTDYYFDPAFKKYKHYSGGYDFIVNSGLSAAGVDGAVGGVQSNNNVLYTGANPKALRDYLNARSASLLTQLSNTDISSLNALGGRRLIVESGAPRQTSMSGYNANWLSALTTLPEPLTAQVSINLDMGSHDPTYTGNVTIPLSRIGADPVILSPIKLTDGGHYSDGPEIFTANDSSFDLSILRPGSADHSIFAHTGTTHGRASSVPVQNTPSGDNLLSISSSLKDSVDKDWRIRLNYAAPFAALSGGYGDRVSTKTAEKLTASTLIISAGQNEKFSGEHYERYIPSRTNLWYGLYIDDHLTITQCDQQRMANLDSILSSVSAAQSVAGVTCSEDTFSYIIACDSIDNNCGATAEAGVITYCVSNAGFAIPNSSPAVQVPEDACYPKPENSVIKVVSHDKKIRIKSLAAAQWSNHSSEIAKTLGKLAGGYGMNNLSLGVVSAGIINNPDLSFDSDTLLIDVDSTLSFAGGSAQANSLPAFGIAAASALSAAEGLILQTLTGAPRVDSAVSKADWYAWNANYDPVAGIHYGPYNPDSNPADDTYNGNSVFEIYTPSTSSSDVTSVAGTGASYIQDIINDGYIYVQPQRADLGPVEFYNQLGPPQAGQSYTYTGRQGRKRMYSAYKAAGNIVNVAHYVGLGKKGGTGVTLPEFKLGELDAEELTKEGYDKRYGKFSVDEQSGNFSLSIDNELSIGGQDHNRLSFSRSYESVKTGSGPLGQGWSHNHDAKIVLSTDLSTAFDGMSPQQNIPVIVAGKAMLELAEVQIQAGDWSILPQSLLIGAWMSHNIFDNQVIVTSSSGSDTFYRAPNNQFVNISNPTAQLTQTGYVKFYEGIRSYVDDITRQQLIEAGATDLNSAQQNPLFHRRFWVQYDQHWDYGDVDFSYTTANKTVMTFPRSGSLLTDAPGLSCFTSSLLPYLNSSHSGASCGKEDGAWRLDEVTSADGRVLKYDYANGVLSSVTDQRYGNALLFEYEGHFGGIQFVNGQSGFDNPNDPLWLASAGDFSPDSASTHGQLSRLKTVKTNVTGGPEISFNYDDSVQRYSPLLASYIDPAGHYHAYEYEVLGVDQNGDRDAINLLKKFTPSSLTQSVFDISYSDSGRVTHLTDGSGRTVTYGINGARNRSVALDGSETVRLYDPEGNLREMISPSHEGAP